MFNIFNSLAPGGLDLLLLRRTRAPGLRLFARALAGGAATALLAWATARLVYGLPAVDAGLLALALAGFAVGATAGGGLRNLGHNSLAFSVTNLSNWAVFAAGLIGFVLAWRHEAGPLSLLSGFSLLLAVYGWQAFRARASAAPDQRLPWSEVVSLIGLQLAMSLVLQLERVLAPYFLDIVAVAEFNVLASVAIFPFRTLQAATGLVLVPRLRAAPDRAARLALLRKEVAAILAVLLAASAAIIALAGPVTGWLTGGRYTLGFALLLAGCVNGWLKMLQAFPQAIVTAHGTTRDLAVLNSFAWLGILAGVAGAALGARWGLAGLVYGTAIGSLAMLIPGTLISARLLRGPGSERRDDPGR